MTELDFCFLPQLSEKIKKKEIPTRWECRITENNELDGKQFIPLRCLIPSNLRVTLQEKTNTYTIKHKITDAHVYKCLEAAMGAVVDFRDHLEASIKIWENNHAKMNYKTIL